MTEPVTPKAERRVIDGEVIEGGNEGNANSTSNANARRRAHNRSQKQPEQAQSQSQIPKDPTNAAKKTADKRSSFPAPWLKKTVLWGSFLAVIGAVLFYTRPNMDWQIEHINRLQSQVAQLHETNKQLVEKVENQQLELDARISEVLNRPENQPLISQADIDAVKADTQQQISGLYKQVQTDLTAFSQQTETQWQRLSENAQNAVMPSDANLAGLSELEQKVENRLTAVGNELSQLFAFKDQQTLQNQQVSEEKSQLENASPLNPLQIQQWAVEINNQWLLKGHVAQTETQLLALEQALTLSELPNLTEIARTIGQDLSKIKAFSEQSNVTNTRLNTDLQRLSALVIAIPLPTLDKPTSQGNAGTETVGDAVEEASSLDKILEKFSGLVSVKKREGVTELSSVDGLLLHDVLMQRLTLLVNRVQWAANIQSSTELQKAATDVEAFIALHLSGHSADFNEVLEPLKAIKFANRPPLAVVNVNSAQ